MTERLQRGDRGAFARFAARWDDRVFALAYRMTRDTAESEDIRQTALMRVYQRIGDFRGRAGLSTWLYRIVVNLCRDRLRSRLVRERALAAVEKEQPAAQEPVPGPERAFDQSETARRVADAVASLPPPVREVVIMRHYQELKFAEIAEIVGAPLSTVKSRMAQGLRLLRTELEDLS